LISLVQITSIFEPFAEGGVQVPVVITLTVADNADGTGGVATMAGSLDPSDGNNLYAAKWTGVLGSLPPWQVVGSRTGDGTFTIVGWQGRYAWEVWSSTTGSTAVSNVVYQPLTNQNAVDSVLNDVLDQVVAGLGAVLRANSVVANVLKKKLPRFIDEVDDQTLPARGTPAPQFVVSGEPVPDDLDWHAFTDTVRMTYRVNVTQTFENQQDFAANLPFYAQLRQWIRTYFSKPAGQFAAPVYDVNFKPADLVPRGDFAAENYDVSVLTMDVVTTEQGSGV
jgi:hypothetical protein